MNRGGGELGSSLKDFKAPVKSSRLSTRVSGARVVPRLDQPGEGLWLSWELGSSQRQKERAKPEKRCRLFGRFRISGCIGARKKSIVNAQKDRGNKT
jgi:hypothetical protein